MKTRRSVLFAAALLFSGLAGLAASSGSLLGLGISSFAPALWIRQHSRSNAFFAALCYYTVGSTSLIATVCSFFGASASTLDGIFLWVVASILLALPWFLCWTDNRRSIIWRFLLGSSIAVLPPLGLIGWLSPLAGAGALFPATGVAGLILTALLPLLVAWRPFPVLAGALSFSALLNSIYHHPSSPAGWESHDTAFGDSGDVVNAFRTSRAIQSAAMRSHARVVVFPEAVLRDWTEATDLFWADTIRKFEQNGQTLVVGATIPIASPEQRFNIADSLSAMNWKQETHQPDHPPTRTRYRNVLLARGTSAGTFDQRIPVPLGMWQPLSFGTKGVPLNLRGSGVFAIAGQRAAVLICYEQLIPFPILASLAEHPSMILAIANDHWVNRTPIPRVQTSTVTAWARLFGIPIVSAVNR